MYKRFNSFEGLVEDFKTRDAAAIRYEAEDGSVRDISYKELAQRISSEIFHVKAACSTVEVIRYELDPDSLVDIFAHVIAGCDIIIADSRMPEEYNELAMEAAEKARFMRETQRDERGRIRGRQGEGELLFFTSGTTSRSKIVRLTSASVCASAWSGQKMLACGEGDVLLSVLTLSHAYGFVCSMLWGLAYGATVALGRSLSRFTGDALFFDPTIIPAVPSQMADMLNANALNSGLKTVLIGGAPCPQHIVDALKERGVQVYIGYGLSETSSGIAISQDADDPYAMYPCPEADIRIEEDGEISVATPCMMQGYLGRDPMFEKGRFYTGDIGWLDEKGRLHLKGRKKDVLIMEDGTKIFCPEFEEALVRATEHADLGVTLKDGRAVLVAGSCPGDQAEADALRSKLLNAIEDYSKDAPLLQHIQEVIVRAEALPRSTIGKLKRYELQELFG